MRVSMFEAGPGRGLAGARGARCRRPPPPPPGVVALVMRFSCPLGCRTMRMGLLLHSKTAVSCFLQLPAAAAAQTQPLPAVGDARCCSCGAAVGCGSVIATSRCLQAVHLAPPLAARVFPSPAPAVLAHRCPPACPHCPAVRGAIAIKSAQYSQQLAEGQGQGLPFDKVYQCNIGNPQILGQASGLGVAFAGLSLLLQWLP